jgi:hypothetical protein
MRFLENAIRQHSEALWLKEDPAGHRTSRDQDRSYSDCRVYVLIGKSLKPKSLEDFQNIYLLKDRRVHVHNLKDMRCIWGPEGKRRSPLNRRGASISVVRPGLHRQAHHLLGRKISSIWIEREITIKHVVSKLFATIPLVFTVGGARKFFALIVPKLSECHSYPWWNHQIRIPSSVIASDGSWKWGGD